LEPCRLNARNRVEILDDLRQVDVLGGHGAVPYVKVCALGYIFESHADNEPADTKQHVVKQVLHQFCTERGPCLHARVARFVCVVNHDADVTHFFQGHQADDEDAEPFQREQPLVRVPLVIGVKYRSPLPAKCEPVLKLRNEYLVQRLLCRKLAVRVCMELEFHQSEHLAPWLLVFDDYVGCPATRLVVNNVRVAPERIGVHPVGVPVAALHLNKPAEGPSEEPFKEL
jgi:hypothetical protein